LGPHHLLLGPRGGCSKSCPVNITIPFFVVVTLSLMRAILFFNLRKACIVRQNDACGRYHVTNYDASGWTADHCMMPKNMSNNARMNVLCVITNIVSLRSRLKRDYYKFWPLSSNVCYDVQPGGFVTLARKQAVVWILT
jgi:hypothetical protein